MLVLAMQFSKGRWAERGPERNDAPAGEPARAGLERPFRAEQRTERSSTVVARRKYLPLVMNTRGPN
jgi:hypothetical protein